MSRSNPPRLTAVTRPLDAADFRAQTLIEFADAQDPLVWVRDERGLIGIGEALRLTFSGADRFTEASRAWRDIASAANSSDPLGLPGTGLLALGTFAFADDSSAHSVLIVPRVILGTNGSTAWRTDISLEGEEAVSPAPARSPLNGDEWRSVGFTERAGSADAYRAGVREANRLVQTPPLEKIVLSRQLTGRTEAGADLRVPLQRLTERYTDCWTFSVDGMIGASPETLVRVVNQEVTARVLAGTRKRSEDPAADERLSAELGASDKEQHEHALAVLSVVDALEPHVDQLRVDETPYLLELPNVWHLATDVSARLADGTDSIRLAGALHPTAAVAGTPTDLAIQAIAEIEPFDRGRYAGAVGWMNAAGDGEWAIALRSAQVERASDGSATVTAFAGGGIVAGSDPDHELLETVAKFRPIVESFT